VGSAAAPSHNLVLWLIWSLRAAGDYPSSRHLAEHAHERWAINLGLDHLSTIVASLNLAATLWAQGEHKAAQDVLPLSRMLGDEHSAVVAINKLTGPLPAKGEIATTFDTRENLFTRLQQVFGDDHPHTITAAAHLAATYWARDDFAAAQPLFRNVMERAERILGAEHPHTIRAAAYLVATLRAQGKNEEAQPLCRLVLLRARRVLGESHPDTIRTEINLAATLYVQRNHAEARHICRDVLARAERALGTDHPDTISIREMLADIDSGDIP
jgi:hypothetical protein